MVRPHAGFSNNKTTHTMKKHSMLNQTVRFWDWVNDGPVKLTLNEDRPSLTHTTGGSTDEGYSHTTTTYTLFPSHGEIRRDIESSAQDCDGPIDRHLVQVASVARANWFGMDRTFYLEGKRDPVCVPITHNGFTCTRPDWRKVKYSQRDYYAEAAGY